jgi:hypothetical protein
MGWGNGLEFSGPGGGIKMNIVLRDGKNFWSAWELTVESLSSSHLGYND